MNPIEWVFSNLKHPLQKTAPRSADAICLAIGNHLEAFTPQEFGNTSKTQVTNEPRGMPLWCFRQSKDSQDKGIRDTTTTIASRIFGASEDVEFDGLDVPKGQEISVTSAVANGRAP